jgi:ribosomal protein S18 acetylase RimI-like enzyme
MAVAFRRADVKDIPLLRRLADEIWHAHYPGIISIEQIDYMLGRMYAPETIEREMGEGTVWELILLNDQAVGYLSYGPAGPVLKLHKLYVHTGHHGQGLGRAALARVRTAAQAAGASCVRLFVNKRNLKAVRAYEHAGFRVAESVVTDFGSGFVMDDYRMELALA